LRGHFYQAFLSARPRDIDALKPTFVRPFRTLTKPRSKVSACPLAADTWLYSIGCKGKRISLLTGFPHHFRSRLEAVELAFSNLGSPTRGMDSTGEVRRDGSRVKAAERPRK
jgi:hypothetical protein